MEPRHKPCMGTEYEDRSAPGKVLGGEGEGGGGGGGGGGAHMETATPVDSSACPLRVESLRSVSTLVTGK